MIITEWDVDLMNKVVDMALDFVGESGFNITACRDKAIERLSYAVDAENGDLILAIDDETGQIMGGCIVYAEADWQIEPFGYLEKFFVAREYRGTRVGREIAGEMSRWFDAKGCVYSFGTSTANIGMGGQFKNLMAKFGYADIGPTLARELNHG